jgi:hypothetical protein
MLIVTYTLILNALSITKTDIITLESSLISVYYNIYLISKHITLVSSCVNPVSNLIISTKSSLASYVLFTAKELPLASIFTILFHLPITFQTKKEILL